MRAYLVHDANNKALLLNFVALDRVLILEDFAYDLVSKEAHSLVSVCDRCRLRTGVDQLLVLGIPAPLFRDLLLNSGDLWPLVILPSNEGRERQLWVKKQKNESKLPLLA